MGLRKRCLLFLLFLAVACTSCSSAEGRLPQGQMDMQLESEQSKDEEKQENTKEEGDSKGEVPAEEPNVEEPMVEEPSVQEPTVEEKLNPSASVEELQEDTPEISISDANFNIEIPEVNIENKIADTDIVVAVPAVFLKFEGVTARCIANVEADAAKKITGVLKLEKKRSDGTYELVEKWENLHTKSNSFWTTKDCKVQVGKTYRLTIVAQVYTEEAVKEVTKCVSARCEALSEERQSIK